MKRFVSCFFCVFVILFGTVVFAGPLIDSGSGDLRLQLPDTDGTSDVSIENSSGTEVGAIGSDGKARFKTSDSGIPVYLSTTASVNVSGKRAIYINNDDDVITFVLHTDPTDCLFCFRNRYAQIITIDPGDYDYLILKGTAAAIGEAVVSIGAADEFICFIGIDGSYWMSMEMNDPTSWAEASP